MMMPLFSVSSRFSDRGRKGAPLFSVSIGRPRGMMMPLFSVSSRFSDRGRKGAPLFSVSNGRPRPMMMPPFSVSLPEFSSAMTLLQLTHNARMRQANTPDLSAMAMPTPLS